ncbi:MAG TPA: cadherin-like domain-containing protein [Microthrixaceae bacterium]|nr:cadherin-like domain-containing protein [Microthrixaceae bacterium]
MPVPGWGSPTDGIFNGTEDQAIVIQKADLLFDDQDPEGEAVTWNSAFAYQSGSSVQDNGASITFTPGLNREGTDYGFYYTVKDEANPLQQVSQPIFVVVNLAPVQDPIVAQNDVINRDGSDPQVVAATSMTFNDIDPDAGDTKNILSVAAGNGLSSVTLNADDSVSVDFAASYTGRATYTYTVEDSAHAQSTATVTLNRLPVATGEDLGNLDEGQNSIFVPWSQFLGNDVDPDGDPSLSVQIMGVDGNIFATSFFGGVQISLRNSTYTGPAQLQYRVSDGTGVSNTVTATMTWVEGNDAPVANTDYWFNNSTAGLSHDTRPAFNPMAGVEDQPMQFPASLLIGGQFLGGTLVSGRDTDEDLPAQALSIDPNSLGSPYGTVTLIDVAGVPTIRFEPFQNVNSVDPFNGQDDFRPYIFYQTTDGLRSSATGFAYLHLAPQDDVPVANDDVFFVAGGSAWSLDIGDVFGTYDVRANDSSPDDYPYGFDSNATAIVSVAAVSGIDTISFDGFTVDIVGSGGPAVFSYTLRDSDGDESTAQVTLSHRTLGPVAFYFSGNPDESFGNIDDSGRELWGFDPTSFASLATGIDDAETSLGLDSGDPMEITPVSDGVFWRGSYNGSLTFDEFFPFGDYWSFYNPNLPADGPFKFLGVEVGYDVFDEALDPTEQNLGIRAGHDFWGAGNIDGPTLTGWDLNGNEFATVFLAFDAHNRELLTDAGGVPAFAAYSSDGVFGEQLWAVLPDQQVAEGFFTWDDLRLTAVSNGPNVIREIAGLQAEENPNFDLFDVRSRVFYFAGDYYDDLEGEFRANALWRVISTYDGDSGTWSTDMAPEWLDNGSSGIFDSHAHGLTVVTVPDDDQFQDERLFFFQDDDTGDGHIATIEVDVYGAVFSNSTGTKYFGDLAFTGREIRPFEGGVVFSGQIDEGNDVGDDFVALYQDLSGGQGFYSLGFLYQSDASQDVEQLVVSDQHQLAFVVDNGDFDELWYSDGFSLSFVTSVFGDITEVAFAGDQLAYVMPEHTNRGSFDRLHHYDPFGGEVLDRIVPTDETTYPFPGSGNFGINNNVNISGGMVFEGYNGFNSTRYIVNNGAVVDSGLFAFNRGAAFQGDWLGVVDQGNGVYRLQLIDSTGSSSELPGQDVPGNDAVDAVWDSAVLGNRVLYGLTDDLFRFGTSTINQVRVYDAGTGTTTVLLSNHLMGRAETVGSEVIFNALDFGTGLWKLYSYDGAATTELTVMQSPNGTQQPVNPYTPGVDFLGHGNVLFWKQAIGFAGEEAVVFDRGVPGTTVLDMRPGTDSGGAWGDAVAANGRFYWQASTGPLTENMRLFTVVDEAGFTQEVTGPLLYDVDIGTGQDAYQFPYLPQVIGNRVYFMGNSVPSALGGSGTWAVFEINTDGVPDLVNDPTPDDATARMITPTDMGFVTGLSAIGSELYFGEGDQVWKMDPLVPGSLQQLTQFTDNGGIGQFFQGSDGNIYFSRDVPWTGAGGQSPSDVGLGSELWMLDESVTGAHLVIDLNRQVIDAGYNPTQLVGVPDPLEMDVFVVPT